MGYATPNGKELQIVKIDNSALYGVTFKSGGELPKSLAGRWTSMVLAEAAIVKYVAEKEVLLAEERQKEAEQEMRREEEALAAKRLAADLLYAKKRETAQAATAAKKEKASKVAKVGKSSSK